MFLRNVFFLILTAGLTFGCGSSTDDDGSGGFQGQGDSPNRKSEVTRSDCRDGLKRGRLIGRWQTRVKEEKFDLRIQLRFTTNSIRVINTCKFETRSLVASIQTRYRSDDSQITVVQAAKDRTEINEPDFEGSCDASLNRGNIPYEIFGGCLIFGPNTPQEFIFEAI